MAKCRIIFAMILLAGVAICTREIALLPDGRLHVHVLDIGQGSAALIITPSGKTILVDGGPDTTVLQRVGEHLSLFQRTIDLVIISHADLDHIAGIPEVLRRYAIGRVLLNGEMHDSAAYAAVLAELHAQHIPILFPDPAIDIDMGDGVTIDTVWPRGPAFAEGISGNDASVVIRVLCGSESILLPGDAETAAENGMLTSGTDVRSTLLVAGHHGSKSSSSTGFLLAVAPSFIGISAGRANQFGHPHAVITDRFASLGIPYDNTAQQGTLSFRFCGT